MSDVLIVGGAGYIGSVVTQTFLEHGYHVSVLDSLIFDQVGLMPFVSQPNFQFIRGDVRDENSVKAAIAKHDVIIWLAAIVGVGACERDAALARSVNVESVRTLNRLRASGQRVIYTCTDSVYGTQDDTEVCTEETPPNPISLYGQTKAEAEREILARPGSISLRLSTVFGVSPQMRFDTLVNNLVLRAYRDRSLVIYSKDSYRRHVHVADVAEAFRFAVSRFEVMEGKIYNVGHEEANVTKGQLAELIGRHLPGLSIDYAPNVADPDKRNYIVSGRRFAEVGFAATRTLDDGVRELLRACALVPKSSLDKA
jgi:nucleoside-diphosphate-sugar epimerase